MENLDAIKHPGFVFDPSTTNVVGPIVGITMIVQPGKPLATVERFHGSEVYAIYYAGAFPTYSAISKREHPILVGKAVHAGTRKGGGTEGDTTRKPLYSRLSEHAESVRSAENLDILEFHCRFLVVDDIWIPLGESLLIARFSPVWNAIIDGFGNHDPGSGRYKGMRPRWDVLHPGRPWATKCGDRAESPDDIARDVSTYLRNAPFPTSTRFIGIDQN
jgi:hypothetical protein